MLVSVSCVSGDRKGTYSIRGEPESDDLVDPGKRRGSSAVLGRVSMGPTSRESPMMHASG